MNPSSGIVPPGEESIPHPFPYAPHWWQCCISFPDERDKVLIGREGGLLLDYEREGRGRRHFRTVIEPGLEQEVEYVSQSLESPKVPFVSTQLRAEGLEFFTETFAAVPGEAKAPLGLSRVGGEEVITGWDGPRIPRTKRDFICSSDCPPEFRDVAWAVEGQPIIYEWRVAPGSGGTLVAGFAEGEFSEAGRRLLLVEADGAATQTIDPVGSFGPNRPGLLRFAVMDTDGDGVIRFAVRAATDSPDQCAFLNALWAFSEEAPSDDIVLAGEASPCAFASCGHDSLPPRRILSRIVLVNHTGGELRVVPVLRVWTIERLQLHKGALLIGHRTRVRAEFPIQTTHQEKSGAFLARFPDVVIPAHGTWECVVSIDRHGIEEAPCNNTFLRDARLRAIEAWNHQQLPYGILLVPDERIQALIDSSVRNIYQARDIQNGLPAFHVGPTCYRQLWIVDGAFLLETATLLGRAQEARAGLDYMLGFQDEDGGFQLKARYWKEAGIVLWTVMRHARLTGDLEWLRSVWPRIEQVVNFLRTLREREEAADPTSPIHRLAPYGDIDGGVSNMSDAERMPEFSNAYWILVGLKAAAEAAALLGEDKTAAEWSAEFDDFLDTFRKASLAHMRKDAHGNSYLPIRIGADDVPQKGQWAFCHAVHPGGVFPEGDPFVQGMLAMLDATKVEGLVFDTGWMPQGLWSYFASFIGHAHLWHGQPAAARNYLVAMADHASPVLVWREEQKPLGCGTEEVGDMPHNWASAEFIRLAFHLVAMERGRELHLLHGVPSDWIENGKTIAIRGAVTDFGPLTMQVVCHSMEVTLEIHPLAHSCDAIVVHQTAWDKNALPLRLDPTRTHRITLLLP